MGKNSHWHNKVYKIQLQNREGLSLSQPDTQVNVLCFTPTFTHMMCFTHTTAATFNQILMLVCGKQCGLEPVACVLTMLRKDSLHPFTPTRMTLAHIMCFTHTPQLPRSTKASHACVCPTVWPGTRSTNIDNTAERQLTPFHTHTHRAANPYALAVIDYIRLDCITLLRSC